jgi:4'-phosphopantetheinyl transferase
VISRRGEIGLDVEGFDRAQEIAELGAEVFSDKELASLVNLGGAQRDMRATELWTLKEAYVKALGVGLSVQTKDISFSFEAPQQIQAHISQAIDVNPERWWFCLLEHEKHAVSLVVENAGGADLSMWTVQGVSRSIEKSAAPAVTWFQCEKSWR